MNETDDVDDDGLAVMGFLDLIDDGLFADTGTAATHSYSAAPTLDRPPPHLPFLAARHVLVPGHGSPLARPSVARSLGPVKTPPPYTHYPGPYVPRYS